jgi:putative DNA primase/helicase
MLMDVRFIKDSSESKQIRIVDQNHRSLKVGERIELDSEDAKKLADEGILVMQGAVGGDNWDKITDTGETVEEMILRLRREAKKTRHDMGVEEFDDYSGEDISFFHDKLVAAKIFSKKHPIYFDSAKSWWMWDKRDFRWNRKDDIDILNIVKNYPKSDIIKSTERNEIISALKSAGRETSPLTPPDGLVQYKNKIINVYKNTEESEATSKFFFTNPIPWEIGNSEETPVMDKLFKSWVSADKVAQLYEYMAYCALPSMPINLALLIHGKGRNGKDQYVKVVKRFLDGNDFMNTDERKSESKKNCVAMSLKELEDRFTTSRLYKKLMVEIGEIDEGVWKYTALWKALTGGSGISGQYKGKDSFTFTNYAKPFIHTNNVPEPKDNSRGFFRRFLSIKFTGVFDGDKDIKDIYKTIPDEEFRNFAKKSIRLLREVLARGSFTGELTDEEKEEDYIGISTPLGRFISEECEEGENFMCLKDSFVDAYQSWSKDAGALRKGEKALTIALKKNGYDVRQVKRKSGSSWEQINVIKGIKLKSELFLDELQEEVNKDGN